MLCLRTDSKDFTWLMWGGVGAGFGALFGAVARGQILSSLTGMSQINSDKTQGYEATFEKLDVDEDGKLCKNEIRLGFRENLQKNTDLPPQEIEAKVNLEIDNLFASMDTVQRDACVGVEPDPKPHP